MSVTITAAHRLPGACYHHLGDKNLADWFINKSFDKLGMKRQNLNVSFPTFLSLKMMESSLKKNLRREWKDGNN